MRGCWVGRRGLVGGCWGLHVGKEMGGKVGKVAEAGMPAHGLMCALDLRQVGSGRAFSLLPWTPYAVMTLESELSHTHTHTHTEAHTH